jgi:hypothetical protein
LIPLPLFRNVPARPELDLYAEIVFDAVRLVRGEVVVNTKAADVAAARAWTRNGNVGVVTFNEACGWLGWDHEHTRKTIFCPARRLTTASARTATLAVVKGRPAAARRASDSSCHGQ